MIQRITGVAMAFLCGALFAQNASTEITITAGNKNAFFADKSSKSELRENDKICIRRQLEELMGARKVFEQKIHEGSFTAHIILHSAASRLTFQGSNLTVYVNVTPNACGAGCEKTYEPSCKTIVAKDILTQLNKGVLEPSYLVHESDAELRDVVEDFLNGN